MKRPTPLRIAAITVALTACGAYGTGYPIGAENAKPLVLHDAELDLNCPQDKIRVTEIWGGVFEATGCGAKKRYSANCDGVRCEVHNEDQPPVPFKDRPEPGDMPR